MYWMYWKWIFDNNFHLFLRFAHLWKLLLDSYYQGIIRLQGISSRSIFKNFNSQIQGPHSFFFIFWLRFKKKGRDSWRVCTSPTINTRDSGFLHLLHCNLRKYIAAIAALSFNPPFMPRATVQGEAMANKVIVFWQSGGAAHGAEFQIKWVRNLILIDTPPRFDTAYEGIFVFEFMCITWY